MNPLTWNWASLSKSYFSKASNVDISYLTKQWKEERKKKSK